MKFLIFFEISSHFVTLKKDQEKKKKNLVRHFETCCSTEGLPAQTQQAQPWRPLSPMMLMLPIGLSYYCC